MKKFNKYIEEGFKLSKACLKDQRDYTTVTIANAQDGDMFRVGETPLYFIYKCLNTNFKYGKNGDEETIIYHCAIHLNYEPEKRIYKGPKWGVGAVTDYNIRNMKFVTGEDKEKVYDAMEEAGYRWDEDTLKLIKI